MQKQFILGAHVSLNESVRGKVIGRAMTEPPNYDIRLDDGSLLNNVSEALLQQPLTSADIKRMQALQNGK